MISALQSANLNQVSGVGAPKGPMSDASAPATGDFGSLLSQFASNAVQTIQQGEAAAIGGINGAVPMQDVVEKVMAAEQALHSGIALRDKIVAAYLEVSRMTI
jgi:flagellar hook-basal body complex protein FliE